MSKEHSFILNEYFNKGKDENYISNNTGIKKESVIDFIKNIENTFRNVTKIQKNNKINKINLLFNISHNCNFNCKYCNANSKYYCNDKLMTFDVIKKTIVYFLNYYQIDDITFYGGEPTLNLHVIKKAVSFIKKYINFKGIKYNPKFLIITNGSYSKAEWFEFLKDNNIEITISIDGPNDIHNFNRKYKSGKDTYNDVIKSINLFKKHGIKLSFDATFTPEHIYRGYTPFDIVKYINDKLNLNNGIILYANGLFSQKEKLLLQEKYIGKYIDNYLKNKPPPRIPNLDNFISPIIEKSLSKVVCPGGEYYFAIDAYGDIYPCHGFFGNKHFILGNIHKVINSNKQKIFQKKIQKYNNINKECIECWINIFCVFCPAEIYNEKGTFIIDNEYCDIKKSIMNKVIFKLGKIVTNKKTKNLFLENWKKNQPSL